MKKDRKFPDSPLLTEIWRRAAPEGLRSMTALASATGIPYDRFVDRMHHPEKFTVQELTAMHITIEIDLASVIQEIQKG